MLRYDRKVRSAPSGISAQFERNLHFSGTPCQISGLKAFLRNTNQDNLLTVEVICEGVPSPLYIRKYEQSLKKKFGALIESIDYRYKGHSFLGHHKWDFEIMRTTVMMNDNKKKVIEKDRWFTPFWDIWLSQRGIHSMKVGS